MTISNIDDFVSSTYSMYIYGWLYPVNSTPFLTAPSFDSVQATPVSPGVWFNGSVHYSRLPVSTGTSRTGIRLSGHVTGFCNIPDPTPGKNKYLCGTAGHNMGMPITLIDSLVYITGMPTASTGGWVDINSTYLPARDATGGSNGYGVKAALILEGQSSPNLSTGEIILQYTNSDGVWPRTGYIYEPKYTRNQTNGFYPFMLQPGDKGVRSVSAIRLNTGQPTNTVGNARNSILLYRELAEMPGSSNAVATISDLNTNGLVEIYSGTTINLILNRNANTNGVLCNLMFKFVEK